MADKYDKLLKSYFTGELDILYSQRISDLLEPHMEEDVNSDIRSSNSNRKPVEFRMIKLEEDELLNSLDDIREKVKALVNMFDDQHKQIYFARYRNKLSWKSIEWTYFVDKRTGQRWCNELKDLIKEHHIIKD